MTGPADVRPRSSPPESFDLSRFVQAQDGRYDQALAELRTGRKRTHWIWYVLPQLRELGRSATAREYGIQGLDEAVAYLAHPVLGPRLLACVQALLMHREHSATEILGEIDAMKCRSCLTLFHAAAPEVHCFADALRVFYQGMPDVETLRLLASAVSGSIESRERCP